MDAPNNCSRAGFRVERDDLAFLHAIPKKLYFKMVEGCCMSALTSLGKEASLFRLCVNVREWFSR